MKKFASLLLTVVMLATMLSVFAVPASAQAQTIDGTDITWELTENDTKLIIDGKGAMPDYDITTYEDRPWHSAAETVTAVQVKPGITALGKYAFFHFEKLTSVTIPDGVTSIGKDAFDHCESLTSVTIPSGVTNIGDSAFHSCTSLESVTIPSGVTSIRKNTFANCTRLEGVTIPSGVTDIGDSAFCYCTSLTSITIPYGVKNISKYAFQQCTNLKSVSFPSSLTNIGSNVFNYCSNLTSVTVKAKTAPYWSDLFDYYKKGAKFTIYTPDGTSKDYSSGYWSLLVSQGKVKEAYVVDDQPGENGTIMLDKDCFPKETYTEPNKTVTVTVMPADGYRLKADSLLVTYKDENGAEKTADLTQDETDPMKYTFTMPCSNVTVTAEFEKIADEGETDPTASTLSEGSLVIICTVAVAVVFGLGGFFLGTKKKKKPALASGENKDEE